MGTRVSNAFAMVVLGALVVNGAGGAGAADAAAAAFLTRLQRAIGAGDRPTVSTLVGYPATVLNRGMTIPVINSNTLLQMYDGVFTPELRCAILESGFATTEAPAPPRLAVLTGDALSFASGLAIARRASSSYLVSRLTVPPGKIMPRPRVERIAISEDRRTLRKAQVAGRLARDQVDTYLVAVKAGDTLEATIEGFGGHDATVRVTGADEPFSDTRVDQGRRAARRATVSGVLRVEVVRLATFCAPDLLYRTTLTLR